MTQVADNEEKSRYELTLDGGVIGWIDYERSNGVLSLTHTWVEAEQRSHGHGERLVRDALDDVRERGLAAEPICPFVIAYIRRHPEYGDLVA